MEEPAAEPGSPRTAVSLKTWVAATAALCTVAVALTAIFVRRESPTPATPVHFEVSPPEGTRFHTSWAAARISPDGQHLWLKLAQVGASGFSLWVRRLDSPEIYRLAGTERMTQAAWAPDSRSIAFLAGGKLKRVDVPGGRPQQVVADAPGASDLAWSPTGTILLGSLDGPILRLSPDGGIPTPATRLDESRGETRHRWPYFLPDGKKFLFWARASSPGQAGVYAASLEDPGPRALPAVPTSITMNGFIFFELESSILARRLDTETLELTGEPSLIAENAYSASISGNGVLAFVSGSGAGEEELLLVERDGGELARFRPPGGGGFRHYEFSPDGQRIAAELVQEGQSNIWSIDIDGGVPSRLTFDPAQELCAVWSPDGKWIYYTSGERILRMPSTGAGSPEVVAGIGGHHKGVSPDGQHLVFEAGTAAGGPLVVVSLDGGEEPRELLDDGANPQFSPDGRWIAYNSRGAEVRIFVESWPPGKGKWQISQGRGSLPRWRGDGRELFFLSGDGSVMAVSIDTGGGAVKAGTPQTLFQARLPLAGGTRRFDVSQDGQRFVYGTPHGELQPMKANVVLNWPPALAE